ncbi:hypothetical protein GCM10011607_11640 [Shewanella inventionis]|uniref:Uncharacterized protein n=1 Tax=Shewanella inventionis TaxID=1738770 RepID=A0ABQ1IYG5_9GAMM|nr:hypothetical protein [Shewanella inventionis]GGB52808.1 hypothetical protein GCM10011607_11640 [Shewanella inventionis]
MDDKDRARKNFAALMLQSAEQLDDFAAVIGLSDKLIRNTKNDLAKKIRPSSSPSSRGISKSDLLNVQLMAILRHSGYDFSTAEFDENMIITRLVGPNGAAVGFQVTDNELSKNETIVNLFNKTIEQKSEVIALCKLSSD